MATRGKPFEPGNTCGRGRPRGSRNKTTLMAQELLDSYAEPLVKKCLQKALQGDPKAMQLCMDRVLPARRDMPVRIGKLSTRTAADVSQASDTVIQKVAAGRISPAQGQAFAELIEGRRRTIETQEFDERLRAMEAQNK
jgi:hypothetical protein